MASFLLHRSLTTGLTTSTGYHLFPSRVAALAAALQGDGTLAGTPWAVATRAAPSGGAEYDLLHLGAPFARGWLCFEPAAHAAVWRSPSLEACRGSAAEPAAGPWLLTYQLPAGSELARKDPPLRLEARQLLNETAQAVMGDGRQMWTPPRR